MTFWPGIGKVKPLAPGVYADEPGNIHVNVSEMLKYLSSEDTPANRAKVADALTNEAKRLCAGGEPLMGHHPRRTM